MKRLLLLILAAASLIPSSAGARCKSRKPMAVLMAESEIRRNPSPTTLDGIPVGEVKWNYTTGLELLSIMDAAKAYKRPDFFEYATRYYDTVVRPDGEIISYDRTKYNLDHVCPGRALFDLYDRTHETRYRRALDTLYRQLTEQPHNEDGGFWHKLAYPHQMWLDGLYMAEPFYAEYVGRILRQQEGMAWREALDVITDQFVTVGRHTYDPMTELYRHAYDDSRKMFWCDSVSGQSAHAWGRAMGWYAMAIVETLQYFHPDDSDGTREMVRILNHIYEVLPRYADPKTGMWYQVLDQPGRKGNYLEATASVMFVYAQLKGIRLGYLPASMLPEAQRRYEQLVKRFIKRNPDGTISLTDCCAVAGLGGKQRRSGTFEYYISEPVIENDCKGVGPFIWASIEYDRAKGKL